MSIIPMSPSPKVFGPRLRRPIRAIQICNVGSRDLGSTARRRPTGSFHCLLYCTSGTVLQSSSSSRPGAHINPQGERGFHSPKPFESSSPLLLLLLLDSELHPQPWLRTTPSWAPSTRRPSRRPGRSCAPSSPRRAAPLSCSASRKPSPSHSLASRFCVEADFRRLIRFLWRRIAQVALGGDVRRVVEDRGPVRDDEDPGGAVARRQRGAGHRGADARAHQGGDTHHLLRRFLPGSPRAPDRSGWTAPIWSNGRGSDVFSPLFLRSLPELWPSRCPVDLPSPSTQEGRWDFLLPFNSWGFSQGSS